MDYILYFRMSRDEAAVHALERSCATYNGNRGVVTKLETKLVFKAEQIIRATESLDSSR